MGSIKTKLLLFTVACFWTLGSACAWAQTDGCTLVVAYPSDEVLVREGNCDERVTPASSFKIPLAVMGYDAGILVDERRPAWPFREGFLVNKENDRETTDPTSWEKNSVVWYSQELTKKLGMEKFQDYVDRFGYGNRDLSGHPGQNDGLTRAWLLSSLRISAVEQAAFVRKLLSGGLDVSPRAQEMTRRIVPEFRTENGWVIKGKTGSALQNNDRWEPDPARPVGWFVGWAEKDGRTVIFARLHMGSGPSEVYGGLIARDGLLERFSDPDFLP